MHLESKFNLNTVGDQGISLGLLQIHRGGLAPRDLTSEDLKNTENNIRIAITNITRAYNRGLQKSLKGPDLLKHVINT
ncbi:Invasion protein IagB domain protein (plasmid) [Bacillus thuringiensis MC28]|nr:Invasion protein IagB domain protein [Bacillus thuringiensis MC28]